MHVSINELTATIYNVLLTWCMLKETQELNVIFHSIRSLISELKETWKKKPWVKRKPFSGCVLRMCNMNNSLITVASLQSMSKSESVLPPQAELEDRKGISIAYTMLLRTQSHVSQKLKRTWLGFESFHTFNWNSHSKQSHYKHWIPFLLDGCTLCLEGSQGEPSLWCNCRDVQGSGSSVVKVLPLLGLLSP